MQSKLQTIEKLFLYFLMAAIIGWCYEVFLESCCLSLGISKPRRTVWSVLSGIWSRHAGIFALLWKICKNATIMACTLGKTDSDFSGLWGSCHID